MIPRNTEPVSLLNLKKNSILFKTSNNQLNHAKASPEDELDKSNYLVGARNSSVKEMAKVEKIHK